MTAQTATPKTPQRRMIEQAILIGQENLDGSSRFPKLTFMLKSGAAYTGDVLPLDQDDIVCLDDDRSTMILMSEVAVVEQAS